MHRNYLSEDIVDFMIVWKEELEDVTNVLELETLSHVSGCSK